MKILKRILNIFANGCVIFSVITLFAYTLGAVISKADQSFIPSIKWIWLFFLFSVLLSLANEVFKADRLPAAGRLLIHFAASAALFYVVVVLCGGFYKNGSSALIAMAAFTSAYIIAAIFFVVYMRKRKTAKQKEEKYNSVFK